MGSSKPRIEDLPVMPARQLLEYRIRAQRPVDAILFSIGTGKLVLDEAKILDPNFPTLQNQYLATILAADVLIRAI